MAIQYNAHILPLVLHVLLLGVLKGCQSGVIFVIAIYCMHYRILMMSDTIHCILKYMGFFGLLKVEKLRFNVSNDH